MSQNISFHVEFTVFKGNLDNALSVLSNDWVTNMSDVDRQSWADNSDKTGDISGKMMFEDYFMRAFSLVNSNVTLFSTVSLGVGTSYLFLDRATRTWTTG
ncbi:MAG: hypothetical protein OEV44_10385 [Spirochaetota bacterium]|nr:hypothetical protein [Spirochaetota bacterium]